MNMDQLPLKTIFNEFGIPELPKKQQEQQDAPCCDTKIWLWDQDQYDQFDSDYLNQIFPYKINANTMVPGAKFIFHFLASSLHYWVELVQEKVKEKEKEKQNDNSQNKMQEIPSTQNKMQQKVMDFKQEGEKKQQEQKLGLKHVKFIKNLLKTDETDNWIAFQRWGEQFMQKQKFHTFEEQQQNFQPPAGGEVIQTYKRNDEQFVVIKYLGNNKDFNEFKQRMEVLFLFYIDGVSFVKEETQPWVYFVVFKKKDQRHLFVGVLSEYEFKISTLKQRHRISQVFIMPNYQKYGHGKELIDIVYQRSLNNPNCFQITTEIPSFEYQCLRDYKETEMLLESKLIDVSTIKCPKNSNEINVVRENLLSKDVLRQIKTRLKLPGHQIQRIAHILIFQKIVKSNDDMARAHFEEYLRQKIIFNRSPFKSRSKLPHITFYGESPQMKEFYLEKAKEDFLRNQQEIQELLTETINGYNRVINKLHRTKKL